MPPLPVTVLTGFLGSGKTTLLRRLLGSPWGRRIGLLLNERGIAGIDDVGPREAGFIEMSEGCVCCVDQPDLVAALNALAARGNLDRVILETTGLADPLPITWTLSRPDLEDLVLLEAVVTAVDVVNHDETRVEEWTEQVRCADLVVLTKLDLAKPGDEARARAAVRAANPRARVLVGDEGLLSLLGADQVFGADRAAPPSRDPIRPVARHSDFVSCAFAGQVYEADALEDLVEDLPPAVFRAKGIARLADGRWLAFQAVGGRTHLDFEAPPPAHGESRLVFFGRALDRAALDARLAGCRARTLLDAPGS